MKNIILALLGSILLNCNTGSNHEEVYKKLDHNQIAILNYNESKNCFREEKSTHLTKNELNKTNTTLVTAINQYNKKSNKYFLHLNEYKFQYTPVINSENKKIVWINAFKKSNVTDWHNEIVIYKGLENSSFFILSIDLSNNTASEIKFNI